MFDEKYEHIPIKIFTSYSHKDEDHRENLDDGLAMIRRQTNIEFWNDRGGITAGDAWDQKIKDALDTSDIILLLFSTKFLASSYIYDVEMKTAIERHNDEKDPVCVIPVLLKKCSWRDTIFKTLQAIPRDNKPIVTWADQDEAYLLVAQELKRSIEQTRKRKAAMLDGQ